MAVELESGSYDNPVFKARAGTDANDSSDEIYENIQKAEIQRQQKPKSNSDVTPKEDGMQNVKVHLVLVSLGILCVLLLGCIGIISWAGWKLNQQNEAMADFGNQNKQLSRQTDNLNQIIQLLLKFNTYPINESCNSRECLLCQTGWIFFNESCYLLNNNYLTWEESRQFCQDRSADLVVVDSLEEQVYINDHIRATTWLGLRRAGNIWVWVDGHTDTLEFWGYGPDSSHSYAVMFRSWRPTASWYSRSNSSMYQPLCEQKAFKMLFN